MTIHGGAINYGGATGGSFGGGGSTEVAGRIGDWTLLNNLHGASFIDPSSRDAGGTGFDTSTGLITFDNISTSTASGGIRGSAQMGWSIDLTQLISGFDYTRGDSVEIAMSVGTTPPSSSRFGTAVSVSNQPLGNAAAIGAGIVYYYTTQYQGAGGNNTSYAVGAAGMGTPEWVWGRILNWGDDWQVGVRYTSVAAPERRDMDILGNAEIHGVGQWAASGDTPYLNVAGIRLGGGAAASGTWDTTVYYRHIRGGEPVYPA